MKNVTVAARVSVAAAMLFGAAALMSASVAPVGAAPHKWKPGPGSAYGGDSEFRWPWEASKPQAEPTTLQPSETLLLQSTEDALQNKIAYPTSGDARVTASILTLEPGQRGKVLEYETPMFGYVLEGEITLNYGRNGVREFRAGESMLQPMNRPFRTINEGGETAKILLVSMGATGAPAAKVVAE